MAKKARTPAQQRATRKMIAANRARAKGTTTRRRSTVARRRTTRRTRRPKESIRLIQTAGIVASASMGLDSTIPRLLAGDIQGALTTGVQEDMQQLTNVSHAISVASPAIAGYVASKFLSMVTPNSLKIPFGKYNIRL